VRMFERFPTEILPPIVVGVLAIYLLLPRPQKIPKVLGVVAGIGSLILGALAIAPEAGRGSWIEAILFYSFSTIAIVGGVLLITQSKPARAAVSFALVVLSSCGLFLLQAAPFLMAGTVIIYAGAIVVTFLFVIMLAQQHGSSDADERSREPLFACLAGGLLLTVLLFVIRGNYDASGLDRIADLATRLSNGESKSDIKELKGLVNQLGASADATAIITELERVEPQLNDRPNDAPTLLRDFARFVATRRTRIGDLTPSENDAMSSFAGNPSNAKVTQPLPAANVVALGRTLFSDYLLGVELAGTLLLVATIGAIAITHRSGARRPA